jgi:flagellin-like protein
MENLKKAQSEVITTVILILIGIAAVSILSVFIINMVRSNLKGTDCFEAMNQLEINLDKGWTYYSNPTMGNKFVYVNVERETKNFNLTGLNLVYGDDLGTTKIKLLNNTQVTGVEYVTSPTATNNIILLPGEGESKTYRIDVNSLGKKVTRVIIAPIINGNLECEQSDEKEIPEKT